MKRTRPAARRLSPLLLSAIALALAVTAPAADAAFPGKPGPIAYSQSYATEAESGGGIFAHGPRASQKAHKLTSVDADGSPSYSADGRSIVFAAARDAAFTYGSQIYAMSSDGQDVRPLTGGNFYDSNPAFSPDGQTVVFDRMIGTSRTPHIFTVRIDGSGLRQLTSGSSADYEPTFTPDGRRIVFVSNRRSDGEKNRSAIFSMAPDGSHVKVLIDTPRGDAEPDVSPNGRRLLFMSNRDGGQNIYVAGMNGKRIRPLLKPVSSCIRRSCYSFPVWSPDEKHIAAINSGSYSSSLVVLRADGNGVSKTFASGGTEEEGYGTRIGPPSWGPIAK